MYLSLHQPVTKTQKPKNLSDTSFQTTPLYSLCLLPSFFLFLGDLSDRCLSTEDNVLCSKILLVAGGSSEVEFLDSCLDCEKKGCLEIENYPLKLGGRS